jgi:hypothetical protein
MDWIYRNNDICHTLDYIDFVVEMEATQCNTRKEITMNKTPLFAIMALFMMVGAFAQEIKADVGTIPTPTKWQSPTAYRDFCYNPNMLHQAYCQVKFGKDWKNSINSGIFERAGIKPVNAIVTFDGKAYAVRCDPYECHMIGATPYFFFPEDLDAYHQRLDNAACHTDPQPEGIHCR